MSSLCQCSACSYSSSCFVAVIPCLLLLSIYPVSCNIVSSMAFIISCFLHSKSKRPGITAQQSKRNCKNKHCTGTTKTRKELVSELRQIVDLATSIADTVVMFLLCAKLLLDIELHMWAKVQAFHMWCQRRILWVKWNDFIPNVTVAARHIWLGQYHQHSSCSRIRIVRPRRQIQSRRFSIQHPHYLLRIWRWKAPWPFLEALK